jgi:hypothetical protein
MFGCSENKCGYFVRDGYECLWKIGVAGSKIIREY